PGRSRRRAGLHTGRRSLAGQARRAGRMAGAVDMYRRSVEECGQRVMAIGVGDWSRPTPCSEWSVRDLVRHLVYEELWAPPLLAGATIADIGDRFEGGIFRDDPHA